METSGFLFLDKPKGISSNSLVIKYKKILNIKKIGHSGTLDPMATGLMILAVGKATKLLEFLLHLDKEYTGTIRLGISTKTDDAEGDIIYEKSVILEDETTKLGKPAEATKLTKTQILAAFSKLNGNIEQIPSSFSAKKISGKRAYMLARAKETVKLNPQKITVYNFLPISNITQDANTNFLDIDFIASVSSGTYIRALARDLGKMLKVGGHLTVLRRTKISSFALNDITSANETEMKNN
jgi:tRNA pseudouridine55 synthase